MRLAIANGWLTGVRHVPSPNCDDRPQHCDIDLLVVHGISLPPGEFGGPHIDALFTNCLDANLHPYFQSICGLRVSAHVLIRRDGELVQYVPFQRRAWHAGQSWFGGRQGCNDFSVGVEVEGTDDILYETVQYQRLAELAALLRATWPGINEQRIVGHRDIAPTRRTDPGPTFDWEYLHRLIQGMSHEQCGAP
jgi:AmpD protein